MAVDIPLLLPIDEFLVKRHDMGKHALRFIIRMTTGVVYSIAMHVLLITAYALLTFQIFYTKDFDLVLSFDATSVLSFVVYLLSGLVEIVGRTFLNDQVLFTFFGHVSHMVGLGSMFLLAYNKVPSNHIEAFAFCFLGIPFFFWTFFVMCTTLIQEYLRECSLNHPLA
ncbi:unnamed protein product [Brassica rapa subsp. trilocularis]